MGFEDGGKTNVIWKEHVEIGILTLHFVEKKSVAVLRDFWLVSDAVNNSN